MNRARLGIFYLTNIAFFLTGFILFFGSLLLQVLGFDICKAGYIGHDYVIFAVIFGRKLDCLFYIVFFFFIGRVLLA